MSARTRTSRVAALALLAPTALLLAVPPAAALAGSQPFDISVSVNRTGLVDQDGRATVTGTVTCTVQDAAAVGVSVEQPRGRAGASGGNSTDVPCGPEPTTWTVQVITGSGPFRPGSATVTAFGFACVIDGCVDEEVTRRVTLRRG